MKKQVFFIVFFVFGIFLLAPYKVWAATCNKCGHYQIASRSYHCEMCGSYVYVPPSQPNLPMIRSLPTDNKFPKIPKEIKGKGKIAIAAMLIAIGSYLFFENTWLGISVIILGLIVAYSFFKGNSKGNKTTHKTTTDPPKYTGFDHSANEEKRLRPTRTSQTSTSENIKASALINDSSKSLPDQGSQFLNQGKLFCNGADGRPVNYDKAIACFQKAKDLGCQEADAWLESLKNMK